MIYNYLIKVYAYLVKAGRKTIEEIPAEYQILVAEMLVKDSNI